MGARWRKAAFIAFKVDEGDILRVQGGRGRRSLRARSMSATFIAFKVDEGDDHRVQGG